MKKFTPVLLAITIFLIPSTLLAETKKEASLGLSYVATSGNSKTQTLGADAIAKFEKDANRILLNAGAIYGTNEGEKTADYWYGRAKDEYTVSDRAYLLGALGAEGNKLAGYGLRLTLDTGVGYRFIQTEQHELSAEIGPGYVHENRIGDSDLDYLSGRAYAKYTFKFSDTASFSQDVEYLHDFEESDNYRVNAETALTFKLSTNISFKTGLTIKYVNMPPGTSKDTDVYSSSAIIVTF